MRRRFTFWLFLPAIALMPLLAVTFGACSSQGEGERCGPEAGNAGADDCQSGLICVRTNNTNAVYRCCPSDRTQATTSACALPGTTDANSSVPEAATSAETSSDATDTGPDGAISSEAQAVVVDGAADAPSDGTVDAISADVADATADAVTDAAAEAADARARADADAAVDGAADGSDATPD
ncbi:MAG: hypothetical protein M3O50_02350 [Myxococcota bacterium]|nr:hypothetical protein [Myxococcota bacterium]